MRAPEKNLCLQRQIDWLELLYCLMCPGPRCRMRPPGGSGSVSFQCWRLLLDPKIGNRGWGDWRRKVSPLSGQMWRTRIRAMIGSNWSPPRKDPVVWKMLVHPWLPLISWTLSLKFLSHILLPLQTLQSPPKMYRSGKIGLTNHFKTVWARNVAEFGLAHPLALGLGMCLAVEGPDLIPKSVSTKRKSSNQGSSHQGGQRNFG